MPKRDLNADDPLEDFEPRASILDGATMTAYFAGVGAGHHVGPQQRVAGLVGSAQSMIVLLYVCTRFGYDMAGAWGAAVPLTLFALTEAVLLTLARRR
jgi:hypothetical protein